MDGNFTVTQDDMLQAVRESALLANVTIGMFNAEKSDRTMMEKVKQDAQATGDVGRFVKNIMAGVDDKLKNTRNAFAKVRTLHYSLTLPWVSDPHAERQTGPRLLPHLLLDTYLNTLSMQKRVAMGLLEEFLAEYPTLVGQAKTNLGSMADADYPGVDDIRRQFRIHFDFEPIPAGASFKSLSDHVMERLTKSLQARQARMVETASQAMWDEIRARVGHMVDRLEEREDALPGGTSVGRAGAGHTTSATGKINRFKKSTIENVRELITLLPGWNLAGAPEVTQVIEDIRNMLEGVDAESLRKDAHARAGVLAQAKSIMERIG